MKKTALIFLCISWCAILVTGCSSNNDDNKKDISSAEAVSDKVGPAEQEDNTEENEDSQAVEEQVDEADPDKDEASAEETSESEMDLGSYEVYLGGEMIETEEKIMINGESNLLPGSRIIGEVSVGDKNYFADTTEKVEDDGSFYLEIANHDLDKKTDVVVKFDFDGQQDDEIKRHYGDRGQKLEGPYIYKHKKEYSSGAPKDIFQKVEVSTSFEPSEEFAIRHFKEPNWGGIPDDMGDPRVWIEVDEINNDKDYFYLHGRSNLLEGSQLIGMYNFKSDTVSVLPDGTFDMKFDYEYSENSSFKIEFNPFRSQWNIIEETYGAKGQKLVGDLVAENSLGSLSINKEVPLESTEINVPDNVDLTIEGTEVTMLVPDNLLFDFDKYNLKKKSAKTLTDISKTLEKLDKEMEIEINGHTDNQGDKQYNKELSEKRAEEVKKFLMEHADLKEANVVTKGYGDAKPVSSNDTEKGQAKNRRVEIVINLN